MDDGISIRDRILKRMRAQREEEDRRLIERIRREAEKEKQRAVAEAKEKSKRALAAAEKEKQHALAEAEKQRREVFEIIKSEVLSQYKFCYKHDAPEDVQQLIHKAQFEYKDLNALNTIFNFLKEQREDEEEFMRFAKAAFA
ncbi:MAG: hypothetical protein IAB19_09850 [Proteobacteria bacterium]|uniref:Uncharacterized protein n=1 Tax=Candidatus Avisuccinivibrio stercorigallinarum TaxID=2840704 RepID=A0A9D9DDX0_9GAMM|nr:hypothetical protein [Candidatus Avisuccinivibrio stercorigallinarum]